METVFCCFKRTPKEPGHCELCNPIFAYEESARSYPNKLLLCKFLPVNPCFGTMDNLENLVHRLETVTVKLENLSSHKPQLAPKPAHLSSSSPGIQKILKINLIYDVLSVNNRCALE